MTGDTLSRGLGLLGVELPDGAEEKLSRYFDAIEEWNPAYGLVGASGDELVIKHLLDSLVALPVVDKAAARSAGINGGRVTLADLGTGAGLPGIPLAIARPDIEVFLVDRMTRRIRFLEAMKSALLLDNVNILENQVEHAKGQFDILTFRAFRPFEKKLFKKVFGLCSPGGTVVAYKGRREKAESELAEITGLYDNAEIVDVRVPFLEDPRCLVILSPTGGIRGSSGNK